MWGEGEKEGWREGNRREGRRRRGKKKRVRREKIPDLGWRTHKMRLGHPIE